ncbi:MAG TPA: YbaK/EbsC family protein [Gammaproteobacteria bacterium]|nr:YbaK/EbsC family protein [Gammaproteobacteria bacterium]
MKIASKLKNYLRQQGVEFRVVSHPRSEYSMETAEKAHVPGDALAKGVLVRDEDGYLLVVLPADFHIELETLRKMLGQDVSMVSEAALGEVFSDCVLGAVPPIGMAYGVKTIWDPKSSLGQLDEVFFEAGDHQTLVQMSGTQFHELMAPAERGKFSHHI